MWFIEKKVEWLCLKGFGELMDYQLVDVLCSVRNPESIYYILYMYIHCISLHYVSR